MRVTLLASTLALSGGCVVLAPVVDRAPPPSDVRSHGCDLISCARLDDAPPTTLDPAMLEAPRACTQTTTRTMTLTDDATLDASALHCVSLDVTFEPAPSRTAEAPIALQIVGGALSQCDLHLRSTTALASLVIAAMQIEDVGLQLEGAVRLSIDHVDAQRVVLDLGGADPIEPPEALLVSSTFVSLAALGPRAPIRLRDTAIRHASLDVRSIALERGEVRESSLQAELIELLDAASITTTFVSDRMIATGGSIDGSYVERCGSLTVAATHVRATAVERCLSPIDVQAADIDGSAIHGDVGGDLATITHTAIAGDVVLPRGTLTNDALCGTTRLETQELACPVCEPAAPAEVCLNTFSASTACPGLCAATCRPESAPATSPRQASPMACAP